MPTPATTRSSPARPKGGNSAAARAVACAAGARGIGMRKRWAVLLSIGAVALVGGCGDEATVSEADGIGPNPRLPPPHETLIPTVNIAPAKGWPAGAAPTPAP